MAKKKTTPKGVKITYKSGFADTITLIDVNDGRKVIKKGDSAHVTDDLLSKLQGQGFQFKIG